MYSLNAQGVNFFLEQRANNVINSIFSSCATVYDSNFSYATKHVIIKFSKWFFTAGIFVPGRSTLKFHFEEATNCSICS